MARRSRSRRSRREEEPPEADEYLPEDEHDDDDYYEEDDDEEEFREPRRSRRGSRRSSTDEDDDRPRSRGRGRGRSRDDEDDRPRRRSRGSRDEEPEDEPRRGRGRARSRDDKGRGGRSRKRGGESGEVKGGWGEFKRQKSRVGNYPDYWKPDDIPTLVKFFEDAPFATYRIHWFNEIREGRKGFVCVEDNCPACDIMGDRPSLKALFNVAVFDEDGDFQIQVLDAGVRLGQVLESITNDNRIGPLSKGYRLVSATGEGGSYSPNVDSVKERDLEEDFGILPLSDEEIEDIEAEELYDASVIDRPNRRELADVVDDLMDDYA